MPTIPWKWAVILCKLSDRPAVPQQSDYYIQFFTENGTGGICDYWHAVSCGSLDLTGSRVFGWLDAAHSTADYDALVGRLGSGSRPQVIQWGVDAALASGANVAAFRNTLVIINYKPPVHDHGATGGNVLLLHGDPNVCEFAFLGQEMGHGILGPSHSWAANPDSEYGDAWDIMSVATTMYPFTITFKGTQGTAAGGLNARNLEALNAIPPSRRWTPAQADFSEQITLDALHQPWVGNHGFLIAKIPPNATRPTRANNSSFTIEFHHKAGWDQGIPHDAVLIHEIRANGISYIQPIRWADFIVGKQFVTPEPRVFIWITAIDSNNATATLRLWDIPDRCLRKEDSNAKVFLIEGGNKRWVTSPQVLAALGKSFADVRVVPDGGLDSLPDGPDVNVVGVSVTPYPVPVNRAVSVKFTTKDATTGNPVAGKVKKDGAVIGDTNTQLSHNFQTTRKRIDEVWEVISPVVTVSVPGYPEMDVDCGFPEV